MRIQPDDRYDPKPPPKIDWTDAVIAAGVVLIVVLVFLAAQTELRF